MPYLHTLVNLEILKVCTWFLSRRVALLIPFHPISNNALEIARKYSYEEKEKM